MTIALASPYKVYLEHDTKRFSNDCVPRAILVKTERKHSLFFQNRSKKLNTDRRGKIDIAVYKDERNTFEDKVPFCAIEVKGFNPSKQEVIKDLVRNSEYFRFLDRTGESRISFSVFSAFHSYNCWYEKQIPSKINRLENRYKNYLSENNSLNSLQSSIDVFKVSSDLINSNTDENEYERIIEFRHLFLGVIVIFSK